MLQQDEVGKSSVVEKRGQRGQTGTDFVATQKVEHLRVSINHISTDERDSDESQGIHEVKMTVSRRGAANASGVEHVQPAGNCEWVRPSCNLSSDVKTVSCSNRQAMLCMGTRTHAFIHIHIHLHAHAHNQGVLWRW